MLPLYLATLLLQSPATAVSVVGNVEMRLGSTTTPLVRFATVPQSATVITHTDATASLRLASGSLLRLGPRTELALQVLNHSPSPGDRRERFSVKVGRVWASVLRLTGKTATFDVETTSAVAGIRGTAVFVDVLDDRTRFIVDHGFIDVSRDGQVVHLDGAGASITSGPGGLGPLSRMLAPALRELRRDVGGPGALLGGGNGGLSGLPALSALDRELWRRDLMGPNTLTDTSTHAPTSVPRAASTSNVTVRVSL